MLWSDSGLHGGISHLCQESRMTVKPTLSRRSMNQVMSVRDRSGVMGVPAQVDLEIAGHHERRGWRL